MEKITVTLGERSYPITIASGLFTSLKPFTFKKGQQVMIVTNVTLCAALSRHKVTKHLRTTRCFWLIA